MLKKAEVEKIWMREQENFKLQKKSRTQMNPGFFLNTLTIFMKPLPASHQRSARHQEE